MLTTITLSNEPLQFQHAMYKEHVIDTDLNRGLHQKYECLDFKFQGFFCNYSNNDAQRRANFDILFWVSPTAHTIKDDYVV